MTAFCKYCGKAIHETASTCPHCGGVQQAARSANSPESDGPIWPSIASLVLGIACALALFDDSPWDRQTTLGMGVLALMGLGLGIISINDQKTGKAMAITGVVLSSLALLALVVLFLA